MPEDTSLHRPKPPIYAKTFSSRRAMVAYRDGKVYVDTKSDMAHIQDKKRMQRLGTSGRKRHKGG